MSDAITTTTTNNNNNENKKNEENANTELISTTEMLVAQHRTEKIHRARELFNVATKNFAMKNFAEAADDLSEVCQLYAEVYGEFADELGKPYLLYGKSLMQLDPEEQFQSADILENNSDDDAEDDEAYYARLRKLASQLCSVRENYLDEKPTPSTNEKTLEPEEQLQSADILGNNSDDDAEDDEAYYVRVRKLASELCSVRENYEKPLPSTNEKILTKSSSPLKCSAVPSQPPTIKTDELPSTSSGRMHSNFYDPDDYDDPVNVASTSTLQLAWEVLQFAAKIFARQGNAGLIHLAEALTEMANIEFENHMLDGAREDYEKALKIYEELPALIQLNQQYQRAMAEINYKIGLIFLMEQQTDKADVALQKANNLFDATIKMQSKTKEDEGEDEEHSKIIIAELASMQKDIVSKLNEIKATKAQHLAMRTALNKYIRPISSLRNGDVCEYLRTNFPATITATVMASAAAPGATAATSQTITPSANMSIFQTTKTMKSTVPATAPNPHTLTHSIKRRKADENNAEAEEEDDDDERQESGVIVTKKSAV